MDCDLLVTNKQAGNGDRTMDGRQTARNFAMAFPDFVKIGGKFEIELISGVSESSNDYFIIRSYRGD